MKLDTLKEITAALHETKEAVDKINRELADKEAENRGWNIDLIRENVNNVFNRLMVFDPNFQPPEYNFGPYLGKPVILTIQYKGPTVIYLLDDDPRRTSKDPRLSYNAHFMKIDETDETRTLNIHCHQKNVFEILHDFRWKDVWIMVIDYNITSTTGHRNSSIYVHPASSATLYVNYFGKKLICNDGKIVKDVADLAGSSNITFSTGRRARDNSSADEDRTDRLDLSPGEDVNAAINDIEELVCVKSFNETMAHKVGFEIAEKAPERVLVAISYFGLELKIGEGDTRSSTEKLIYGRNSRLIPVPQQSVYVESGPEKYRDIYIRVAPANVEKFVADVKEVVKMFYFLQLTIEK
ncbi:unnamed protein product [Sphagnum jensenii]|uniref:Uncharacterized protein n=1 Tax=Sphagnum jensenii TaxID=128206 RepID=A0ABP0VA39_9BRYO